MRRKRLHSAENSYRWSWYIVASKIYILKCKKCNFRLRRKYRTNSWLRGTVCLKKDNSGRRIENSFHPERILSSEGWLVQGCKCVLKEGSLHSSLGSCRWCCCSLGIVGWQGSIFLRGGSISNGKRRTGWRWRLSIQGSWTVSGQLEWRGRWWGLKIGSLLNYYEID